MTTNKVLFRIASILMIVGGAAGIITNLIAMIGGITLAGWGYGKAALIIIGAIICLLGAIYELIVGIKGTKGVHTPGVPAKLMTPGIIVFAIELVGFILLAIGAGAGAGTIVVDILFGFGAPIFFIITCYLNRNNA